MTRRKQVQRWGRTSPVHVLPTCNRKRWLRGTHRKASSGKSLCD